MLTKEENGYYESRQALTDKEKVFVCEYLIHHNATLAAKKAGYSERSAAEIGWENLRKPHVAAAVEAGLAMIAARCEVSAEKVVRELAAVAFSNIAHYRSDEGCVSPEEGAPPEVLRAIQSVKRKKIVKDDGSVVYETEFKFWDKLKALELLGKKLRLWVEKVEVENPQAEAYRLLLQRLKAGQVE